MATALNLGNLRSVVRLYRQGVDGAEEALHDLLRDRSGDLASVLGTTDPVVDAAHLARLVDAAARREARSDLELAERLALRVAAGCRPCARGLRLPLTWLAELVALRGYGWLGFRLDDDLVLGLRRTYLVAVLRHMREVDVVEATLGRRGDLHLAYVTRAGRGHLTLRLCAPEPGERAVIVDVGTLLPSPEPLDLLQPPPDRRRLTRGRPGPVTQYAEAA